MPIENLEKAKVILKNHYDKQQKVVDASGIKEDILWVKMKYAHSIDVFNIAEYLIDNDEELKKLTEDQKLYGKLSALLHDIGRAYEVGETKEKVKPHGYYGADVILKQIETETNPFILIPVKYHGDLLAEENARKDLENIENLSNEDKEVIIKILYLVMDNFTKRKLVKREDLKTMFDEFVFFISWFYDLNFEASKDLILKNNLMKTFIIKMQEKIDLIKPTATSEQVKKIESQFKEIEKQMLEDNIIY